MRDGHVVIIADEAAFCCGLTDGVMVVYRVYAPLWNVFCAILGEMRVLVAL